MTDNDCRKMPEARKRLEAGHEPLVVTFKGSSGRKKRNQKSYFNTVLVSCIMQPGIGEVPIKWDAEGHTICEGVRARIVFSESTDDGVWEKSSTVYELAIEASACPLYISVFEEKGGSDKDGDSHYERESYWIEVYRSGRAGDAPPDGKAAAANGPVATIICD